MRRLKPYVFIFLLILLVLASLFSPNAFNNISNLKDKGLAKVFKNIDSLYNDAMLVVEARIDPTITEFEKVRGGITSKLISFEVTIDYVYKNSNSFDVTSGDVIKITETMAIKGAGMKSFHSISTPEIKEGSYLLFLNSFYDNKRKERVYVNNSPYHLYKQFDEKKYLNTADYILPIITKKEIEELSKK